MTKERELQIREVLMPYKELDIRKYGKILYISLGLYQFKYEREGLKKLVKILILLESMAATQTSGFDTNIDYGYYDDIDDVKLEFTFKD